MIDSKEVLIKIEEGKEGLFYATCEDIRGLLVAADSIPKLEAAIPKAIKELHLVMDRDVSVVKAGLSLRYIINEEMVSVGEIRSGVLPLKDSGL